MPGPCEGVFDFEHKAERHSGWRDATVDFELAAEHAAGGLIRKSPATARAQKQQNNFKNHEP